MMTATQWIIVLVCNMSGWITTLSIVLLYQRWRHNAIGKWDSRPQIKKLLSDLGPYPDNSPEDVVKTYLHDAYLRGWHRGCTFERARMDR